MLISKDAAGVLPALRHKINRYGPSGKDDPASEVLICDGATVIGKCSINDYLRVAAYLIEELALWRQLDVPRT